MVLATSSSGSCFDNHRNSDRIGQLGNTKKNYITLSNGVYYPR